MTPEQTLLVLFGRLIVRTILVYRLDHCRQRNDFVPAKLRNYVVVCYAMDADMRLWRTLEQHHQQ
jgi:hypothetical protein